MTKSPPHLVVFERVAGGENCEIGIVRMSAEPLQPPASASPGVAYAANEDLPEEIRHVLAPNVQTLYREAYNHAWAHYILPLHRPLTLRHADAARRAAWAAVKRLYVLHDGAWVRRR